MQNTSLQRRISLAGCVNAAASLLAGKGATVEQLFKLAEQIMAELDKRAPVDAGVETRPAFKRPALTGPGRASTPFFDAEGRASRGMHKGMTLAELPKDYVAWLESDYKDEHGSVTPNPVKAEIAKLRAKAEKSEEAPW